MMQQAQQGQPGKQQPSVQDQWVQFSQDQEYPELYQMIDKKIKLLEQTAKTHAGEKQRLETEVNGLRSEVDRLRGEVDRQSKDAALDKAVIRELTEKLEATKKTTKPVEVVLSHLKAVEKLIAKNPTIFSPPLQQQQTSFGGGVESSTLFTGVPQQPKKSGGGGGEDKQYRKSEVFSDNRQQDRQERQGRRGGGGGGGGGVREEQPSSYWGADPKFVPDYKKESTRQPATKDRQQDQKESGSFHKSYFGDESLSHVDSTILL